MGWQSNKSVISDAHFSGGEETFMIQYNSYPWDSITKNAIASICALLQHRKTAHTTSGKDLEDMYNPLSPGMIHCIAKDKLQLQYFRKLDSLYHSCDIRKLLDRYKESLERRRDYTKKWGYCKSRK